MTTDSTTTAPSAVPAGLPAILHRNLKQRAGVALRPGVGEWMHDHLEDAQLELWGVLHYGRDGLTGHAAAQVRRLGHLSGDLADAAADGDTRHLIRKAPEVHAAARALRETVNTLGTVGDLLASRVLASIASGQSLVLDRQLSTLLWLLGSGARTASGDLAEALRAPFLVDAGGANVQGR